MEYTTQSDNYDDTVVPVTYSWRMKRCPGCGGWTYTQLPCHICAKEKK